jgi:hypothetical protein
VVDFRIKAFRATFIINEIQIQIIKIILILIINENININLLICEDLLQRFLRESTFNILNIFLRIYTVVFIRCISSLSISV